MAHQIENQIDLSQLAKMMLDWETYRRHLDEIEAAIRDTVLQIGKTQTVGFVRASYSKGRKRYDYQGAIKDSTLNQAWFTKQFEKVTVDWRAMCEEWELEVPFTQSDPSVSVKLLKE